LPAEPELSYQQNHTIITHVLEIFRELGMFDPISIETCSTCFLILEAIELKPLNLTHFVFTVNMAETSTLWTPFQSLKTALGSGLEQFFIFHILGIFIIATDELHHFSEG
jgi:hypothetical protein